jgi:hypothetical protein
VTTELEVEDAKPTVPAGPPRRSSRFKSGTATVKTEPVDDILVPHSLGSLWSFLAVPIGYGSGDRGDFAERLQCG